MITQQFKTLAEARTAYDALSAEMTVLQSRVANLPAIEASLAESKAELAVAMTTNAGLESLVVQKDTEITGLKTENEAFKTEVSALKTRISELEKGQKTVQQSARELVAASGGAPLVIDQTEINKFQAGSPKEIFAEMAKTTDPVRLKQLYDQFNATYRPDRGKKSKR
jgi:predicted RNase H-like nuclease (RuvC/YqgF family)